MMKVICILIFALITTIPAEARRVPVCFGEQDRFYNLGDFKISEKQTKQTGLPERWALGQHQFGIHLRDHCFIFTYSTDILGYATYTTNATQYLPLDDASVLTLQKMTVLPKPLPPLEVPYLETAQGKWKVILFIVAGLVGLALLTLLVAFIFRPVRCNSP